MPEPSIRSRSWTGHLRPRLAGLRIDPAREAEIIEELSLHLDQRYEELRAGGASEAEARRLALAELLEPGALATWMRPLRQANATPPIAPGAPGRFLLADVAREATARHRFRASLVMALRAWRSCWR